MQNNSKNMVGISDENYSAIKSYCEELGVSMDAAINEALEDFIACVVITRIEASRARAANRPMTFPGVLDATVN